ncbi:MAG: hypothetical protein K8R87_00315 [Verrucomicrobia bacterium]|nr:hypothetical protein [Verrucomicrobiota bacterium]
MLLAVLNSCEQKVEFEEASSIVNRRVGHERLDGGTKKWQFLEVLGPDGPYTDTVNQDYRGSTGGLSAGQPGTFSVSNEAGTVSKQYGGKDDSSSYRVIEVQTRERKNALIVCRMVLVN